MSWRFVTCAALFITCLLTANTIASKLVVVGGVGLPVAIVIFPVSYILAEVRTIGSTIVGEGLDSAIFIGIAFGGAVPGPVLVGIIAGQWAAKVVYEAAATPLTYAAVRWLKSSERVDTFDYQTDFNPIRL